MDFTSFASGAASGGLGLIGSLASAKLNQKYAERNAALSQGYWEKQFGLENARQDQLIAHQDWLNQNSALINKNSLMNAGLSPALIEGNPQLASSQIPGSVSPSGNSISNPGYFDNFLGSGVDSFLRGRLQRFQERNIQSSTEGQDLENEFNRDTMKARQEAVSLSNEQLESSINQIDTTILQILQDTELKRDQRREISQRIQNMESELEGIKINNSYISKLNDKKIEKWQQEIDNMSSEKVFQDLSNKFARLGLFVGNDFMSNLQFIVSSGHGDQLIESILSTLENAVVSGVDSAGNHIVQPIKNFFDSIRKKFGI